MMKLALAVLITTVSTLIAQDAGRVTLGRTTVTTTAGGHAILTVAVKETGSMAGASASALLIRVDGAAQQHIILTPGAGRSAYDALLGPLPAGRHEIAIERSPHWTWVDAVAIAEVSARAIAADDPLAPMLEHAPTFAVRADTIGTASDLPLLAYAEDDRVNGSGWLRYSLIFSNEDGGTAPAALMARWGRTTDIELAYETEWRDGRIVQEQIQGPDHKVLPFRGPRQGRHPVLLVATLNNMFVDRGASVATVRPVPVVATLAEATRESVMDGRPWIYRVMARELASEGRIGTQVEDPREFLYVEARLQLENATVAAHAENAGAWVESSRGQDPLRVERSAWARIAVPKSAQATALKWSCRARGTADASRCRIETVRAFRLDADYQPGPNLIEGTAADLKAGTESAPVVLRAR